MFSSLKGKPKTMKHFQHFLKSRNLPKLPSLDFTKPSNAVERLLKSSQLDVEAATKHNISLDGHAVLFPFLQICEMNGRSLAKGLSKTASIVSFYSE